MPVGPLRPSSNQPFDVLALSSEKVRAWEEFKVRVRAWEMS